MYTQLAFALDRVKALAPQHPEWKDKAALQGGARRGHEDPRGIGRARPGRAGHGDPRRHDHRGVREDRRRIGSPPRAIRASSGRTPSSSTSRCSSCSPICAPTASRPSSSPAAASSSCGRGPSGSTAFRPSRSWARASRRSSRCATAGPTLFRLPQINFVDDKAGKPVGINEHIGRRPIAAFGNSDGDLEMLQWTTLAGDRRRFGLIVHHTDAEREYAYDRQSPFGRLDKALDAAAVNGWTVVRHEERLEGNFPDRASAGDRDVAWLRSPDRASCTANGTIICSSCPWAQCAWRAQGRVHAEGTAVVARSQRKSRKKGGSRSSTARPPDIAEAGARQRGREPGLLSRRRS